MQEEFFYSIIKLGPNHLVAFILNNKAVNARPCNISTDLMRESVRNYCPPCLMGFGKLCTVKKIHD